MSEKLRRRFPIGAESAPDGVNFRVWAPRCKNVDIVFTESGDQFPLNPEPDGYFSATYPVEAGTLYQFSLDDEKTLCSDPASRYLPIGPKGPSQVIDPSEFKWTDHDWKGIARDGQILYELHVGTFTPEGTWKSAISKLPWLVELGVTVIEMMPIVEFFGKFNWGYDTANLFAPTHNYGTPEDLRAFINEAHRLHLGVILDVVYNHFGPEETVLRKFSNDYFKKDIQTEWGYAINFDKQNAKQVRAFFIANAGYWIEEFHFDGFRFDACHAISDKSTPHIFSEIVTEARSKAGDRALYITGENEAQQIHFVAPQEKGGYGLDAIWNEDFHHAACVRMTGRAEAYYRDYLGNAQEFVSMAKFGFLYQGQWYRWQKKRRGSPCLDVESGCFINFLQNHDQVANSGGSLRIHLLTSPAFFRVFSTLLLLSPQTPLLFQGQEFGSTSPFYYFSDQPPKLAKNVYKGRIEFLSQFKSFLSDDVIDSVPPPYKEETFLKSKINWDEKEQNSSITRLYKDLIYLRKQDTVFRELASLRIEGSALNRDIFVLRYFGETGERLVIFNLGMDFFLDPAPEPLLAPPKGCFWKLLWASEVLSYGGHGFLEIPEDGNWWLTGIAAFVLTPEKTKRKEL